MPLRAFKCYMTISLLILALSNLFLTLITKLKSFPAFPCLFNTYIISHLSFFFLSFSFFGCFWTVEEKIEHAKKSPGGLVGLHEPDSNSMFLTQQLRTGHELSISNKFGNTYILFEKNIPKITFPFSLLFQIPRSFLKPYNYFYQIKMHAIRKHKLRKDLRFSVNQLSFSKWTLQHLFCFFSDMVYIIHSSNICDEEFRIEGK